MLKNSFFNFALIICAAEEMLLAIAYLLNLLVQSFFAFIALANYVKSRLCNLLEVIDSFIQFLKEISVL
jgi:hypothetical protein